MRTLLLVGHGSLSRPRAFVPVFEHARAIRETGAFDAVAEAFLKGDPSIGDALESIDGGEVVVVPLFACAGYYTREVIPEEVAAAATEGLEVRHAEPVGTHDRMTDVIRARVDEAADGRREDVGLALVGHGTERNPDSAKAVRHHAERLREAEPFASVSSFFLDEDPRVEALPRAFEAATVVVVPVFMAEGHHVVEDIPERIGVDRTGAVAGGTTATVGDHELHYTAPVGTHPAIADFALDRATEVGERPTPETSSRRYHES